MDSWHSVGLNGTGSHHIKYENILVPDHRSRNPGKPPSGGIIDAPLYRSTGLGVPFGLPAVFVGLAAGIFRNPPAEGRHGNPRLRSVIENQALFDIPQADFACASPFRRKKDLNRGA
ncbi:MAG: hypothetical protein QGF16_01765 [Rhodospirillales bacterium]|jgi:hypothetical protein|nr:hypothetical protein [Rhodospirillales bacterium]|tara:strand:+ start:1363 stop:1713 length:351 start_codon:yes stop_codon:yes gene_type:complete